MKIQDNWLMAYSALDLTDEKGSLCGRILADLGTDVIKVEKPGGDASRCLGPFYNDIPHPERSLHWFTYNAGKKGITLDLEKPEGREILLKLISRADFLIEAYVPSYLQKLGIDYSATHQVNSKLIHISITPYGSSGPYAEYKSSDLVAMATGGYAYITGDADRPPVRISGVEQAYCHSGAHAAAAAMIAHYYRELTGEGQHVDVSIQESVVWSLMYVQQYWDLMGYIYSRSGSLAGRSGLLQRQYWWCKDGYIGWRIFVGKTGTVGGEGTRRLVEAMKAEDMAEDLEQVNWEERSMDEVSQEEISHWDEVFARFFLKHSKAELDEIASRYKLTLFPISTPEDFAVNKQLEYCHYWSQVNHTELGAVINYPGPFVRSTGVETGIKRRAPLIGEHNWDIYHGEFGFSVEEISLLKESGVI